MTPRGHNSGKYTEVLWGVTPCFLADAFQHVGEKYAYIVMIPSFLRSIAKYTLTYTASHP